MNFEKSLRAISAKFDKDNVDFAIIGAFALLQCGIERMTQDIDFIISEKDVEKVELILNDLTYETIQKSKAFSQYESPINIFGNVDFLHATGKNGLEILKNAEYFNILGMKIKVVKIEDLVGLKVLAYANNSDREERDKADIKLIIDAINNKQIQINIDKIVTYYEMFDRMADYNKYWNKDQ